jgi:cyclopropane-fatty-acyl-phospholipid synthase
MTSNLQFQDEDQDETNTVWSPRIVTGRARAPVFGAESLFINLLEELGEGYMELSLPGDREFEFGARGSEPQAHWLVYDSRCFARILGGGALALGESYVDGWWDEEHDRLVDLIGIALRNNLEGRMRKHPLLALRVLWQCLVDNPRFLSRARRNTERHYDLGNVFFEQMLDPSMAYSCGYQCEPEDSLEKMQLQKYHLICAKLGLERGGKLLDIGCGWGGLLMYAAQRYEDITGVGITLSRGQYELANRRIEKAGLAHRLEVRLCDYRQLKGKYDFIVSVGMFEHVGRSSYGVFMRRAEALLKPEGMGLLHTIGVLDPPAVKPDAWTSTYIFPGARLPRLDEILREMRRASLSVGHVQNLQPHYAKTLEKWRENFRTNEPRIRTLGPQFNDRFMRMWNYYLQATEASFRYGATQVYQILFCKGLQWKFKHVAVPYCR